MTLKEFLNSENEDKLDKLNERRSLTASNSSSEKFKNPLEIRDENGVHICSKEEIAVWKKI